MRKIFFLLLFFVGSLSYGQNLGNLKGKISEVKEKAQEKVDQAKRDQKDETKHCICSQEANSSFEQCLAGVNRLDNKRQNSALGNCTKALSKGIQSCQSVCKKQNKLGTKEWCEQDCITGNSSHLQSCEKNFSAESCQGQPNCVRQMDLLRDNCIKAVSGFEASCKKQCG